MEADERIFGPKLQKDGPDLQERVLNGEMSPHRAMIEAGFRKKLTALERLLRRAIQVRKIPI
jgi:hypothetical protein